MADEDHLELFTRGVSVWNRWREDNPEVVLDLSGAKLSGTELSEVDLSWADLVGADLRWADLRWANLCWAELREVFLTGATLTRADLSGATLVGASLVGADLTDATCEVANFSNADLSLARLVGANLDGATLSGVRLWETQRGGWSIKGVVCESVYWDKEGKELTTYVPGEFERLYSEKVKVLVRYSGGMNPLEVVTLPALIQHMEASRPGCKLRFESIQDGPSGAIVTIVVEDAEDTSPAQMDRLRAEIQAEAEQKAARLRGALESERESVLLLKGEVRALGGIVDKLLSRPTFYLEMRRREAPDLPFSLTPAPTGHIVLDLQGCFSCRRVTLPASRPSSNGVRYEENYSCQSPIPESPFIKTFATTRNRKSLAACVRAAPCRAVQRHSP